MESSSRCQAIVQGHDDGTTGRNNISCVLGVCFLGALPSPPPTVTVSFQQVLLHLSVARASNSTPLLCARAAPRQTSLVQMMMPK